MNTAHDRRAPGAVRVPFDAMVEVGGALGPSFEAQAVNLSEEGMSLRTMYLPEVGHPVTCRFDAGQGLSVIAEGGVQWNEDLGNGGEFGIRFTNLDSASTVALQRILGMAEDGEVRPETRRKVRLHIEGLVSPMRARVRDEQSSGVTTYSELNFLQVGKALELEDASSGSRRPASIDGVHVEVAEGSRIPQLVVSLRYEDAPSLVGTTTSAAEAEEMHSSEPTRMTSSDEPNAISVDVAHEEEHPMTAEPRESQDEKMTARASNKVTNTLARSAAKVTPALKSWAMRAKVTAALLAAKARGSARTGDDVEIPVRRTTAPAPGGGLHATGRRVVRGTMAEATASTTATANTNEASLASKLSGFQMTKKKAAVLGSIGVATILVGFALRKPSPAPEAASAATTDTTVATTTAAETTTTAASAAAPSETPAVTTPVPVAVPVAPPLDPLANVTASNTTPNMPPAKLVPFTNGPVGAHPTVLRIKMDGPVEGIQGATQPTGFTIVTPNRKVIEPSTSLASKDSRLEGVRISNETGSAEFTVTFKDSVPNYVVRAHGDTLEMVLAKPSGPNKAEAKSVPHKKHKKSKHR